MPRNKKSMRSRSSSPEKKPKGTSHSENLTHEESRKRDEILASVQDMFIETVEPDVVYMVLSECDWGVEEAIDTLFSLMEDGQQPQKSSSNKLFELASGILTGSNTATQNSQDNIALPSNETTESNSSSINTRNETSLLKRVNKRFVEGLVSDVLDQACSYPQPMSSNSQLSSKPSNKKGLSVAESISSEFESSNPSQLSQSGLNSSETLTVSNLLSIYGNAEVKTLTPSGFISLMKLDSYEQVGSVSEPETHGRDTSKAVRTNKQISGSHVPNADAIPSSQSVAYFNSKSLASSHTSSCAKGHSSCSKLNSGLVKESIKERSVLITHQISDEVVLYPELSNNTMSTVTGSNSVTAQTISTSADLLHQSENVRVNSKTDDKNQTNRSKLDDVSKNCDTILSMTSDENRVSPYILSPQAPEFVPMAKYSHMSTLTSPVFYSGLEVGGARNTSLVHPLSMINPIEMSTPGKYFQNKNSVAKKPWFKPSDGVLLSDILFHSSKNVQPRMKQSPPKPQTRNIQKEVIEEYVKSNKKVLVLLRGCPGSGKSTLARQIRLEGVILTTDDYFMRGNFYEYDQGLLGDAHQWNQKRSENSMKAGISPIIIDNTNSQMWEMKPYVIQAHHYNYCVELLEPQTKWKYRARELAKRNSHGVGLESIQRMLQRFEYKVTVEDIRAFKSIDKNKFMRPSSDEVKKEQSGLYKDSSSDLGGTLLEKKSAVSVMSTVTDTSKSSDPDVIIESVEEVDLCEENPNDEQSHKVVDLPPAGEIGETKSINPVCNKATEIEASKPLDKQLFNEKELVLDKKEMNLLDIQPSTLDMKYALSLEKSTKMQSSSIGAKVSQTSRDLKDTAPYNAENMSISSGSKATINSDTLSDHIDQKCDKDLEAEQQKCSHLSGGSSKTVHLDNSIVTADTPNSFNKVELDMISDMKFKLEDIQTLVELEDLVQEFDALLHFTALSDKRKNSLQFVVGKLFKQTREHFVETEQIQLYKKTDSLNQSSAAAIKKPVPEGYRPLLSEASSWHDIEPKPQRKLQASSLGNDGDNNIEYSISSAESSDCQYTNNAKTGLNQNNKTIDKLGKNKLSKSQKKLRKYTNKRPISPLLRDQERFLTNSWTFPSFNPEEVTPDKCDSKCYATLQTATYCTHSTNTSPRDFNVLHCVNDGYKTNLIGTQFHLLISQERDINADYKIRAPSSLTSTGYLDKSTTTEDLQMNEQFNLDFLQSCFSDVPVEELKDILSSCAQDVGWAVNSLLDWGYDSIGEDPSMRKNIMLNRLRSSGGDDDDEHSLHPVTKPEIVPLTLVDLCSESLKNSKSFSDKKIEDLLIAGSEKRLEIVEKMTMQFQRLLSSDMDEIWVKQGTQLCSYTDSEEESENASDNIDSGEVTDSEELDTEDGSAYHEAQIEDKTGEKFSVSPDDVTSCQVPVDTKVFVEEEQSVKCVKLESTSEADPTGDFARIPVLVAAEGIRTLMALFGPFSDKTEELKEMRSCLIEVDYSVAKTLHSCLKESMAKGLVSCVSSSEHSVGDCASIKTRKQNTQDTEDIKQSGQYIYESERTKPVSQKKQRIKVKNPSLKMQQVKNNSSKKMPGLNFGSGNPQRYGPLSRRHKSPLSFREIQEEELAKQLSKEEYMKLLEARGDTAAISTRLKRQKLQERFPGVDEVMLDEFYEENQFVLEDTSRALQAVLGSESPQTVMTAEMAEKHENYLINLAKEKSLQEMSSSKKLPLITTSQYVTPKYQSVETPDYMDFRAEAITHHQLRQECFQKAQEAFRRGMKDVAVFYSRQGHLHTEKFREADHRASNKILEYRNANLEESSTIDLHGLHPNEAVYHLSIILQQRQQDMLRRPSNRGRVSLSVITGKGVHSRGGKAKVKPAVVEFLKRSAYSWTDSSTGVIKVVLRA